MVAAKYNGSCMDHGGLGVARNHEQLCCEVCQPVIDKIPHLFDLVTRRNPLCTCNT